ncbi:MAG TPA: lysophospholipid acyltransferase family protein [Steroidobacteraceae bacterium]|nr:lysophospholipid acyltransferase family protein [Steroidobacteraceae bacterium]
MDASAQASESTSSGGRVHVVGSLVFTAFLFVWTFVYAIFFVIVCCFLPFPRRFVLARFWAAALLNVLKWTCRLDYVIEGRENLPPGNHIALWKHSSSWETIAMAVVFPRQVWVLKRELLWIPIVGWGIRQLHAIAINRKSGGSAVNQVVDQGRQRLSEGDWVMVFPEGTRMAPGQTRKYGVSGALLARETGRYVVPVAHNAGRYWPRRGLLKRSGLIRVVIGPPIDPKGMDPREVNERAQAWIESTLRSLDSQGAQGA